MLYERNIPLKPDWEMVAGAVVDFALTAFPEVHPEKLVINGWSLGGYLAARAAPESTAWPLASPIRDNGPLRIPSARLPTR